MKELIKNRILFFEKYNIVQLHVRLLGEVFIATIGIFFTIVGLLLMFLLLYNGFAYSVFKLAYSQSIIFKEPEILSIFEYFDVVMLRGIDILIYIVMREFVFSFIIYPICFLFFSPIKKYIEKLKNTNDEKYSARTTRTDVYKEIASKFDKQSKEVICEAVKKAKESNEPWKNESWYHYYYINRWVVTNLYFNNQKYGDIDLDIIDFLNDIKYEKFKKLLHSTSEIPEVNIRYYEIKMDNEKDYRRKKYNSKIIEILELEEIVNLLDKPQNKMLVDYHLKKRFVNGLLVNLKAKEN